VSLSQGRHLSVNLAVRENMVVVFSLSRLGSAAAALEVTGGAAVWKAKQRCRAPRRTWRDTQATRETGSSIPPPLCCNNIHVPLLALPGRCLRAQEAELGCQGRPPPSLKRR